MAGAAQVLAGAGGWPSAASPTSFMPEGRCMQRSRSGVLLVASRSKGPIQRTPRSSRVWVLRSSRRHLLSGADAETGALEAVIWHRSLAVWELRGQAVGLSLWPLPRAFHIWQCIPACSKGLRRRSVQALAASPLSQLREVLQPTGFSLRRLPSGHSSMLQLSSTLRRRFRPGNNRAPPTWGIPASSRRSRKGCDTPEAKDFRKEFRRVCRPGWM